MIRRKLFLLLIFLSLSPFAFAADIFIGLEKEISAKAISIYLDNFAPENSAAAKALNEKLRQDLYYSRYFDIREPNSEKQTEADEKFKRQAADYLISGKVLEKKDKLIFTATLSNLAAKKTLFKKHYSGSAKSINLLSHMLADDITERLSGKKGIARSRLAFANDATGKKEIYIADYDGENLRKLTNDKSISLLPRWSKDNSKIYYTSYKQGNPDIFEIDLKRGKISVLSNYQGLNIPGNVSPDGLTLIMTASRGGDPGIYTLSIVTKEMAPLLKRQYGIMSSPTFSPDGKEIAFISDRSGNPQVHILNMETKKIRKLTNMNWCDSPMWSPDGGKILFAARASRQEKLNIFISDITGSNLMRLTVKAGNNENPVWSPDGRFIAFISDRSGRKQIYIMDSDGSAPHALGNIPANSYTPSWSY